MWEKSWNAPGEIVEGHERRAAAIRLEHRQRLLSAILF
jgi:hypothetical protein